MGWDIGPELRALAALCKELNAIGIGAEMRDSLPGVAVRTSQPGVYIYVFITTTGRWYVWHSTATQHSVNDAPGAAQQIAAFLKESGYR